MRDLPITIDLSYVYASLIVSGLIGLALLCQGVSGLKTCRNHTAGQGRRHATCVRKCVFFFALLYIVKVIVDTHFVSAIGAKLEKNIDKLPKLVERIQGKIKHPQIVLLYQNETGLFVDPRTRRLQQFNSSSIIETFPDLHACLNSREERMSVRPPPEDVPEFRLLFDPYEPTDHDNDNDHDNREDRKHRKDRRPRHPPKHGKHNGGRSKRGGRHHEMDFVPFEYCEEGEILLVRVDLLRGHVEDMVVGVYVVAAIFNLIVSLCFCCCLNCCNRKYQEACESKRSILFLA
jgi:hypothetical protein